MYEYRAKVLDVVDGDTLRVEVDLGLDIRHRITLRLFGVDTPEVRGEEREAGLAAKAFVEAWLPADRVVIIQTVKDKREKYGRYLAAVYIPTGDPINPWPHLGEELVKAGHGRWTCSAGP